MQKLTGKQWRQLNEALVAAFPNEAALRRMLQFGMDLRLDAITAPAALQDRIFELITYTEAHARTGELVTAAREINPGNPDLVRFAQTIGAIDTPRSETLEKILRDENILFDIVQFRARIGELEGQVCRIEVRGRAMGTGFLVGPAAVMTNHHVVADVISGKGGLQAGDVGVRFDYKRLADGSTLNAGRAYRLAADWLIDSSPHSAVDLQREPKAGVPQPPNATDPRQGELDYAILRLDGAPGEEPISSDPQAPLRGYVKLPAADDAYDFGANKALFILQHPDGEPLKLTVNTVRGFNANRTRVTYLNDTAGGSSGSPCFNGNWAPVALHHSGDPAFKPEYNEGIPLNVIVQLLTLRGKLAALASGDDD